MKISFNTLESDRRTTSNGYGNAAHNIVTSLRDIGHSVRERDDTADIQFMFCQPDKFRFIKGKYHIGYTPWESSLIPPSWVEHFNRCDEVWTTSQLCAKWFAENGVTRPIFVFKHGIEEVWTPKLRGLGQRTKFLHVGEPAPRKAGQLTLEAFIAAFGNSDDVSLTIKAYTHNSTRVYEPRSRSIICSPGDLPNVNLVIGEMSTDELVSLFHSHDVLVYPSWGEGFGFIPLQGLATGMPTICTGAWAPYKTYLYPLDLPSAEADSPWPHVHPGKMFQPDFDELIEMMRWVHEERGFANFFHKRAPVVHANFNWKKLTQAAFSHLE